MRSTKIGYLFLAALSASLVACGARTGLHSPDRPPTPPSLCSNATTTMTFQLITDPDAPPLATDPAITGVEWHMSGKCDPSDGQGGGRSFNCTVINAANRSPEISGDCIGSPGSTTNPPSWHVATTINQFDQPMNVGFTFFGTLQGNVCVVGRVFFSDGTIRQFGRNMWPVQITPPGVHIPIVQFLDQHPAGSERQIRPTQAVAGCPGF